jgi:hypothetical protein
MGLEHAVFAGPHPARCYVADFPNRVRAAESENSVMSEAVDCVSRHEHDCPGSRPDSWMIGGEEPTAPVTPLLSRLVLTDMSTIVFTEQATGGADHGDHQCAH